MTVLNLAAILDQHARRRPAAEAVVLGQWRLTYAQLDAMANRIAGGLSALGIGRGDQVGLLCPNLPYFPAAYFGILKAGAIVVPLNVLLKPREIAHHLRDSDAKALLCFEGTPDLPMAEGAKAALAVVPSCRHFIVMPRLQGSTLEGRPLEDAPALAAYRRSSPVQTAPTRPAEQPSSSTRPAAGQQGAELTHLVMVLNAMASAELCSASAAPDGRHVTAVTLPYSTRPPRQRR